MKYSTKKELRKLTSETYRCDGDAIWLQIGKKLMDGQGLSGDEADALEHITLTKIAEHREKISGGQLVDESAPRIRLLLLERAYEDCFKRSVP
jgi:hypothetical protein